MRNIFISLCFISLCFACSYSKKGVLNSENILIPRENIQIFLDSFVKENNNNKHVYELYIDKLDPYNSNLLLYAGEKSLTCKENQKYNQSALASVIVSGIEIKIYSGLERYFYKNTQDSLFQDCNNGIDGIMWAIKDSSDVITIYKIDGGYPFFPFPLKVDPDRFTPPIVKPN
jgi:hypothetical protein